MKKCRYHTNAKAAALQTGRSSWKALLAVAVVLVVGGAVSAAIVRLQRADVARRLLADMPDEAAADPALVRFAIAQGRPLYAQHCAVCHGAGMRGNPKIGAPDLTDSVWLYGDGSVYGIERTILYGIRSGQSKAHNVTDMPAFGQRGTLSEDQIRDLVQYLLKLNRRAYEGEAAEEGRALYYGKPDCSDCHGGDARGDSDYGAPDLTVNVWSNGGDPQSLYDSLYFGRHRIMPGWVGTLTLEQIRALAVYIHAASHGTQTPRYSPTQAVVGGPGRSAVGEP
jgi:cytochrome c oxidase cbb3-type subunit III